MCLCVGLLLMALPAWAGKVGRDTGYPIPRFVSIDKNEANLRTGPGRQYPIRVVLQRRNLPVKVIDEYNRWRKIELYDGLTGWLHKVLLDGRRTFLVQEPVVVLRETPGEDSLAIAKFQKGVIADLLACQGDWCRMSHAGYDGWAPRKAGWGALGGENFD